MEEQKKLRPGNAGGDEAGEEPEHFGRVQESESRIQLVMISFAKRIERVEEYYFSRKLAEVRKLDAQGTPVVNLGIGSPDLPPSASTIEALSATAGKANSHGYQ